MATYFRKACVGIVLWLVLALAILAEPVSISKLIANAAALDETTISIEAEVIGDVMIRGDKTWINISDGTGAIGVYLDTIEAKKIGMTGEYQKKGDIVRVEGIFHHAFDEQAGNLAIEGKSLEVIKKGEVVTQPIEDYKWILLGTLSVAAAGVFVLKVKVKKNN